ncbi:sensor histidine kinase [Lacimicrobium alkaliphilum]|uniref:histidine kinase n=1 Tax=Lacimicrobium alkaliphilum TaxID=1526571 RepID=A0A0U2QM76_9ALTE|nr:HAMP domain-containing sensor histidine kinase [Lacimicrobium alkaliphilum]ALS98523.1 hypothetical protein AT746_09780 [Lacimicrobium alkaliphilum]
MSHHSLKHRLLLSIALITCLTAVLFGFLSFLFAYHIEDSFFERLLEDEAKRINFGKDLSYHPGLPIFSLYQRQNQLPEELLQILKQEPQRREIGTSDGRHFHLKQLDEERMLVAEVSDYLVVRKIKLAMLEFLLIGLALVLLLSLWVTLGTANRMLRPLSKLTNMLETLSQHPPEPGFSKGYPDNEIGMLARTLDQQLQRIQAFIQREQQFTRDISHELRTPVAVFQGALTLLKQTTSEPRQLELIERLDTNQQRMQQCLNTLLALAREENLQPQPLQLRAFGEQALLPHLLTLERHNREVQLDVPGETRLCLPTSVLSIILDNLITNAVAHGQGKLIVRYEDTQLTIANQGPGIIPELQSSLFEPGSKGAHSQGLGMGLSIVNRLCQTYHIALDCQSNDNGTCMTLDLTRVLMKHAAVAQG